MVGAGTVSAEEETKEEEEETKEEEEEEDLSTFRTRRRLAETKKKKSLAWLIFLLAESFACCKQNHSTLAMAGRCGLVLYATRLGRLSHGAYDPPRGHGTLALVQKVSGGEAENDSREQPCVARHHRQHDQVTRRQV